jgi:hypothetical protein
MRLCIIASILILISFTAYSKVTPLNPASDRGKEQIGYKVNVYGNRIISTEDLFKIGRLSKRERFSRSDIITAVKRIEGFYLSKGYDLVEISYLFLMDEWYIFVNEGRIGKIIIKGEDSLKTLVLKNVIRLREDTFNTYELKKILEQIKRDYGFKRVQYRLLPVSEDRSPRLPVTEKLSSLLSGNDRSYIEPEYDLMVIIKKKEWGEGFGVSLDYNSFGLIVGTGYSDSSIILQDDRFRSSGKGGFNLRRDLDGGENRFVLTLVSFDLLYVPSILRFRYFKPDFEIEVSDKSFMRGDIPLNEYRIFSVDTSFMAGVEITDNMTLSYGLGTEWICTHDFDYVSNRDVRLMGTRLTRSYLYMRFSYLVREIMFRSDLRDFLQLRIKHFIPSEMESYSLLQADYQKTYMFAYDYLKIYSGGKFLFQEVPFFDEFSIAYSAFKSSFSDRYYARDAFYLSFEYNLSIYRDIMHTAFFTDFIVFYYRDYPSSDMYWLGAFDGGAGLKVLLLDVFLLRADYVEALAFNGVRGSQVLFSISKVF